MRRETFLKAAIVLSGMCGVLSTAQGAVFSDSFSYPDGQLGGAGPWVGNPSDAATAGRLDVSSGHLVLSHNEAVPSSSVTATATFAPVGPDGGGLITVIIHAQLGSGTAGNIWFFNAKNPAGTVLASWDGQFATARPRIGGSVLTAQPLTGSGYDELKMTLNTNTGIVSYYFNNAFINTITNAVVVGSTVGQLDVQRQGRGVSPNPFTGSLNFDDVSVTPEPATLGLLALGMAGLVRRRKGSC